MKIHIDNGAKNFDIKLDADGVWIKERKESKPLAQLKELKKNIREDESIPFINRVEMCYGIEIAIRELEKL